MINSSLKEHENAHGSLLERAKQGEKGAFGEFYMKYKKDIQSFIYRLTSNYTTSDELMQDTFVNAYTHLKTYD